MKTIETENKGLGRGSIIFAIILGFTLGFCTGGLMCIWRIQDEAVNAGVGHYPHGKFEWKK